MKDVLKSLLVTIVATAVALVGAEFAFRGLSHKRIFALTPYRTANAIQIDFVKGIVAYDPVMGWRVNAGVRSDPFNKLINTNEYGVRRNGPTDDHVRSGGVLVVGSSFTAGAEVEDEAAWPAQLETLIGQPVVNGAFGGFALDQITLRTEELLPVVKPKTLVVDIAPENISWAGYSYFSYPKPYFVIEDGKLSLRNNPVPRFSTQPDPYESLKNTASYSLIVDRLMSIYYPDTWYSSRTKSYRRANNDEVAVSCLLFQRLKQLTDAAGIRLLVSMQYGGGAVSLTSQPDGGARLVQGCIHRMGIQLVDEFSALKELSKAHLDQFQALYVMHEGGIYGHKSRAGNLKVAEMVAAALASPPPAVVSQPIGPAPETPQAQQPDEVVSDTRDLPTIFPNSAIAALDAWHGSSQDAYRFRARGGNTEHYLMAPVEGSGGTYTFSIEAKADNTPFMRLQLLRMYADGTTDGALADFDLLRKTSEVSRIGIATDLAAEMSPIGNDWYRLSIRAAVSAKAGANKIGIQLGNSQGQYGFGADGEATDLRHLVVTRRGGDTAAQDEAVGSNSQ
jgi:hypothetical protein